jgi:hypothetical protein
LVGRNKRIQFSIYFDANSNEFNQLAQIGHLFLGGEKTLPHPFGLDNSPLKPHPIIVSIPSHRQPGPINGGWEKI